MLNMFGSCSENICAVWNGLILRCGDSMNTRMPRLPRIAYSAAEPVSPEVAPRMLSSPPASRQHMLEQVAEQLHRHVLERQRRAVRQAKYIDALLQLAHGRDVLRAENGSGVGSL